MCTVSKCIHPRSIFQTTQSRTGSCPSREQTQAFSTRVAKAKNSPVNPVPDPGRIQTTIQGTSKTIQVSLHQQRLRRLRQTKCLVDLYSRPAAERHYRRCAYQKQSRVLQPTVPGPKTRQLLEASHRPQLSKQIPGHIQIQDGNPRVNTCLPQDRRMGYIHKSDRRLPTCPYSYPVTKVPQILPQRRHLLIYQPPVRPSHSSIGVHKPCERSQAYSPTTGNQTTPIFGRMVYSSSFQTGLHQTNTKTTKTGKRPRICSKLKKSELIPSQRFDFLGYHFLLDMALVKPTQDRWKKLQEMFHRFSLKSVISARTLMSTIGVLASTEKTVKLGRKTYETISVASQNSVSKNIRWTHQFRGIRR